MAYQLPNLVWLRAFEATARHASFTAAANELCLTQPAVSHQVRSLEDHLGFRLIERGRGPMRLTPMGRAYLPVVRRAFEDLSASTSGLFGSTGDRSLTVRATIGAAALWIAPLLPAFSRAYPDIDVRLCMAIWADNLSADAVDVDIRLGDGYWPGYRAERLGDDVAVPVCGGDDPDPPRSIEAFANRPLIHILGYQDLWRRLFRETGIERSHPDAGIKVDSSVGAVELVAQGAGCGLLIKRHAMSAVRAGRLQMPLDVELPLEHAHYLVTPEEDRDPSAEARLFREWLLELTDF